MTESETDTMNDKNQIARLKNVMLLLVWLG